MKINKLFHVLVVTGASSTVGLIGCGSDSTTTPSGASGSSGSSNAGSSNGGTGGSGTAGSGTAGTGGSGTAGTGTAGSAGSSATCDVQPNACAAGKVVNGCCCWIAQGSTGICSFDGCAAGDPCCP
jgi:hypothetical protein